MAAGSMAAASCAQTGFTDLRFPDDNTDDITGPAAAQRICAACPVLTACREYALDRPGLVGVWGGTTTGWRTAARRARRAVAA